MNWYPDADIETLKLRAQWLSQARAFFQQRQVLEVETPVLSSASVPDPNIESLASQVNGQATYLQTSPELYMKRLLASGSGPIYQISRVFRDGELGRLHNPEFTLIEWYQPGYSQQQLMNEVADLVRTLCEPHILMGSDPVKIVSYAELFEQTTGLDPHQEAWSELSQYCQSIQKTCPILDDKKAGDWQAAMDWLLATIIQPALQGLVFVTHYPAAQASLARLDPDDLSVARRFELFIDGIEMANGFEELTDADEQRRRFIEENNVRQSRGLESVPLDERFLAALESGMPETSGVALGLDRLLMWALACNSVQQVMSFGWREAGND